MDLQGDHALPGQVVAEIGGRHSVDEGFDAVADTFDARLVPVALFEGLACGLVVFQVKEPAAPALIIDSAGVGSGAGIDFVLVTTSINLFYTSQQTLSEVKPR